MNTDRRRNAMYGVILVSLSDFRQEWLSDGGIRGKGQGVTKSLGDYGY